MERKGKGWVLHPWRTFAIALDTGFFCPDSGLAFIITGKLFKDKPPKMLATEYNLR